MLVFTACFHTVAGNIAQSHDDTIKLNEEKVCSHVHSDPRGGKETQLKLKEIKSDDGKTDLCCPCNPGFRLNKTCRYRLSTL